MAWEFYYQTLRILSCFPHFRKERLAHLPLSSLKNPERNPAQKPTQLMSRSRADKDYGRKLTSLNQFNVTMKTTSTYSQEKDRNLKS